MRWHEEGHEEGHERVPFSIPNGSSRGRLVSLQTGKGIYWSSPWASVICGTISRWHIHSSMGHLVESLDEDSRGEAALTCSPVSLLAQIEIVSSQARR